MSQNQELQLKYDEYQQVLEALNTKVMQLQSEIDEHTVVLATLKDAPADRKCFRMIGGALVELTAGSASKVLDENLTGMTKSVKTLSKELDDKQKEFLDWKEKNHIRIVKAH